LMGVISRIRERHRCGGNPWRSGLHRKTRCDNYRPIDIGATHLAGSAQPHEREGLPSEKCRSKWSFFGGRGFLRGRVDESPIAAEASVIASGGAASLRFELKGGWNSPSGGQTFKNGSRKTVVRRLTGSPAVSLNPVNWSVRLPDVECLVAPV
jgi:hypothetical protein